MLGYSYFYNESIKNYVATFGALFSNIEIQRKKSDGTVVTERVPLHFSDKTKMYQYIFESEKHISLPRLAFDFSIEGVDENRKTSRTNVNKFKDASGVIHSSLNAVPYNFTFNLYLYANDIEESLQIVEQILPYFQPSLTVKIKPLSNFEDVIVNVPIILESVSNDFETDGGLQDRDVYTWTLGFTLKGLLFNKINVASDIILDVSKVKLYEDFTKEINPQINPNQMRV